jgi:hypothetical protein
MTGRGRSNSVVSSAGAGVPLSPSSPAARTQRLGAWPTVIATAAALTVAGIISCPAQAENADISVRRAAERTSFSNSEIMEGFFKIAFGAELQLGRRVDRVRKFDEPVRVFVVNRGAPDRRAEIAAIIADIRARVDHLDVMMTEDRQIANFVVTLVQKRDLVPTIRSHYGRDKAKQIQQSLNPQCLSGIGNDQSYRIRRAEVILPADVEEFSFYDCAYEELLQALGAINDDRSVPWTMFNDDVQMGFFDVYDQYILNILYHPRVRPGMTKEEVNKLMPEVLPAVRARVTSAKALLGVESRNSSSAGFDAHCNCFAPVHGTPVDLE